MGLITENNPKQAQTITVNFTINKGEEIPSMREKSKYLKFKLKNNN
jgi:hypothetical protein